ncbi:nuclear pore complex protein Nup53 [Pycnococcus provasolii]
MASTPGTPGNGPGIPITPAGARFLSLIRTPSAQSPARPFSGGGTADTPVQYGSSAVDGSGSDQPRDQQGGALGSAYRGGGGASAGLSFDGVDEGASPRGVSPARRDGAGGRTPPPPPTESLYDRMHRTPGRASPAASQVTQPAMPGTSAADTATSGKGKGVDDVHKDHAAAAAAATSSAFVAAAAVATEAAVMDGWVTLYGFPSHMASAALAAFATCGDVAEVSRWGVPASGNFVHVRFVHADAARLAVRRASVEVAPGLIVGARPTTQKHLAALAQRHTATAVPMASGAAANGGPSRNASAWNSKAHADSTVATAASAPVAPSVWSKFVEFVVGV